MEKLIIFGVAGIIAAASAGAFILEWQRFIVRAMKILPVAQMHHAHIDL